MTGHARLGMPWAHGQRLYCTPGHLVMKLPLGEVPDSIPTARDVATGALAAATRVSDPIDRVLRHFSDAVHVTRVHGAAASRHRFGERNRNYNDLEQVFGLARTLRVELERGTSISDAVDALRQLGAVESASPHYLTLQPFAISAVAASARSLANSDQRAAADRAFAWLPHDLVGAAEALAYEPGDAAVIVAIVDTGVASSHPELDGRLRAGFDTVQLGTSDVAPGISLLGDETDEDTEPDDEVGHGSACAGIIGARGDEVPPGLGGACSLLPMRVLGAARMPGKDNPVGIGALTDIDDGVKRAIDLGAKVLNMSFGTPVDGLDAHDPWPHGDVVRYGLAHGCVMVAASGNSGRAERYTPACLDGVVAVGAVGADGHPSPFTTTGDHVALSAPGERVMSLGLEGYQRVTGTSFASPFVAAASALLVARANKRSAPLDAAGTIRILRESARPFAGAATSGYGAGVLDAVGALRMLDHEIDASRRGAPPRTGASPAIDRQPGRHDGG
jgi:subtilisin family serine protease